MRRLRPGRAPRHRAVLAARPRRAERPRRGGHPAGGLREPSVHPAETTCPAAGSPPGGLCTAGSAGRWPAPVMSRRSATPSSARSVFDQLGSTPTTPPASRQARQPALRRGAGAAHHAAAGAARRAAPQRRPRQPTTSRSSRPVLVFGRATSRVWPSAARRPPSHGRGDRRPRRRLPAQPRHAAVVLAVRASRPAGGARAARPTGRTPSRPRARSAARPAPSCRAPGPVRSVAPGPVRRAGRRRGRRGDGRRHAGELHPRVVKALGLPARTCAMELDLDRPRAGRRRCPPGAARSPPSRWRPRTSR